MPHSSEPINCRWALCEKTIISDEQLKLFCSVIRFGPGEGCLDQQSCHNYVTRTSPLIKRLKFPLSRPNTIRQTILPKQCEYTYLCDMHQELNADFVHQWFILLSLEVGLRMNSLMSAGRQIVGDCIWDNVLMPLRRIHKMWLNRRQIDNTFGDTLDMVHDTEDLLLLDCVTQTDGCEACILSRIGSHLQTIMALRGVTHSRVSRERRQSTKSRPRLKRLIYGWLATEYEYVDCDIPTVEILNNNNDIAQYLYKKRRKIRQQTVERQGTRESLVNNVDRSASSCSQQPDEVEDEYIQNVADQAENDKIDTYTALRSTSYLPEQLVITKPISASPSFHPHPLSRTDQWVEEQYVLSESVYRNDKYNESQYSVDTIRNNERALARNTRSLTSNEVQSYYLQNPKQATSQKSTHSIEEGSTQWENESCQSMNRHRAKALQMLEHGNKSQTADLSESAKHSSAEVRRQKRSTHLTSDDIVEHVRGGEQQQKIKSDMTTFSTMIKALDSEMRQEAKKDNSE